MNQYFVDVLKQVKFYNYHVYPKQIMTTDKFYLL